MSEAEKAVITVFTPTYNRAYTLPKLYESLLSQTDKRFCWLIVDDGSTDNTKELVDSWIKENKIPIRYFKQENCGKSLAHNKGVELTTTELFTCVDSDDYLTDNAVEEILLCWQSAQKTDVGILAFIRGEEKAVTLVNRASFGTRTTLKNAYDHGLTGDAMLVFRTDVINKYSFPCFENEKFVPEGYVFDQIDQVGNLILLSKYIYVREYLPDGYTQNMAKLLKNNPQGYLAYITQRLKIDKGFKTKFLDSIRYVAMAKVRKMPILKNAVYPFYAFIAYPVGMLFYCKRYKNV